jgi:hypothetical protein
MKGCAVDFLEYAKGKFKELPANRWTGASAAGDITVTDHRAGVDLSRGPWVKFTFKDSDGHEKELQGYKTWNRGDRIKFGIRGSVDEVDDDQVSFTAAAQVEGIALVVIIKFHFEKEGKPRAYRFEGRVS